MGMSVKNYDFNQCFINTFFKDPISANSSA